MRTFPSFDRYDHYDHDEDDRHEGHSALASSFSILRAHRPRLLRQIVRQLRKGAFAPLHLASLFFSFVSVLAHVVL